MKKSLVLAVAIGLFAGTAAQAADSFDKVIQDQIKFIKNITKVLTTIKDNDSAKAATPKLSALSAENKQLRDRAKKLGRPTMEQIEEIKTKYGKEMMALQKKLIAETTRVRKIDGGKDALAALEGKKPVNIPKDKKKDDSKDK